MEPFFILLQKLLPFLFILTLLVFVHEFGHYISALRHGVKIEIFSIGFGPEIFGFTDKRGTRWKFSLIPLGGYVKMFGDTEESSSLPKKELFLISESSKKESFFFKPVWQKIEIAFAGPLSNYIFAILILSLIFSTVGQPRWSNEPIIGAVLSGSLAEKSGFFEEDFILSVNGAPVKNFQEIGLLISKETNFLHFLVQRSSNNVLNEIHIFFEKNNFFISLGVMRSQGLVICDFFTSFFEAIKYSFSLSFDMLQGIWKMITGQISTKGLSGPLGIAQISGNIVQHKDWVGIFSFIALLSINLGLINLLPIPMLDGGHLLFYFLELLKGKPLNEKIRLFSFRIGFLIVIMLFIYITINDLLRLFES